jgi:hypothetical protein
MAAPVDNDFLKRYEIAPPKVYKTYPPLSPALDLGEFAPASDVDFLRQVPALPRPSAPGPVSRKHAVWIVHGMGQQIPFETLDSLTVGLQSVIPGAMGIPRLRAVKFGEQVVQRVELDVKETDGSSCELHLYEAYWAPVTEGVAKLADVLSFFWDGGSRGILNAFKKFQRAIFGGMAGFTIHKRAIAEILAVLFTLLSLIVINAVVVAAGSSTKQIPLLGGLKIGTHWPQITALASAMCCVALTFGVILFLAENSNPGALSNWNKSLLAFGGWVGFACTLLVIMGSAALMIGVTQFTWVISFLHSFDASIVQGVSTLLLLTAGVLVALAMFWRAILRSVGQLQRGNGFLVFLFTLAVLLHLLALPAPWVFGWGLFSLPTFLAGLVHSLSNPLWVWPFLIVLSANVRTLMIQYVGDVAIYISPNKVDRFDKVRKDIKKIALDSVTGIYQARNDDGSAFEYDKIAIVGHSLGSVIAYDTLNKILTDDSLAASPLGVADRTCLLETFGSPLDKIAFFFTIQGKNTFHIREQLAAVVQPLIQSYVLYRKFPWINVYSRSDIISGDLFLFDLPQNQIAQLQAQGVAYNFVKNIPDPDAVVPLAAHVDYWKNKLVWQKLYAEIRPVQVVPPLPNVE